MNSQQIKEIAYKAWMGAANAFRLYPNNKHTFSAYWDGSASEFDKYTEQDNKSKTDFQVMQIMSQENKDICMCPDMIEAKTIKGGGKIVMGVPHEALMKVCGSILGTSSEEYHVLLYIVNKKQFDEIKKSK